MSALPGEAGDLGSRALALLVDGLALALVLVPIGLAARAAGGAAPQTLETVLAWFVLRAVADATGGSPGKRLLRLRVIAGGGRPGLAAGAARNLWALWGLAVLVLPPLLGNGVAVAVAAWVAASIARHPAERGWHDRLAGTAVRRIERAST